MAQVNKPKRKFTTGTPTTSDLSEGEIAINTSDRKIWMRDGSNNIVEVANAASVGTGFATEATATALAIALG